MSMRNKHNTQKLIIAIAMLPFLILSAFAQSTSSSLGGTVMDPSKAVLPGVTVQAVNIDTGVEATTLTNNAGKYNFPALQPGLYKVSAELQGFNKSLKTDVKIGGSSSFNVNFDMQVAGQKEVVTVTTSMANQIIETSSSTGTVLAPNAVTQLPLVSNDVLDLINIMGGTIKADNPIFYNSDQSFAGVNASNINLQRDGITINEVRYQSGIVSASRVNTESVAEFKMILSPVDAELGRGMGQVQILTKSGTNAYHGSGVWNFQNTALDANEFDANRNGTKPDWRNLNNYVISANGPIKKNKTFFFATWDQAIARSKTSVNPMTLTPCAKKGIFRYFNDWTNGNFQQATNATAFPAIRASVDTRGTPLDARYAGQLMPGFSPITLNPAGTGASSLKYASVLGTLDSTAQAQVESDLLNCSNYDPWTRLGVANSTDYYDSYRRLDSTGYIKKFNDILPAINNYEIGDGLNTGGSKWTRSNAGEDTVFGSGEDNNRKSVTTKIDHNFNDRNRMSGTFNYENDASSDQRNNWPNGYVGTVNRKPYSFTVSLTSTIKPTLLNEARFGVANTMTHTNDPLDNPATGQQLQDFMQSLMSTANFPRYAGKPLLIGPGGAANNGMVNFSANSGTGMVGGASTFYGGSRSTITNTFGGTDRRWTMADTVTWTRGTHNIKFGAELRLTRSNQDTAGDGGFVANYTIPTVWGGATKYSMQAPNLASIFSGKVPGLAGYGWQGDNGTSGIYDYSAGNYRTIQDLQSYMAGSVGSIKQYFFVNSPSSVWNDASKGELSQKFDVRQREMSFFAKDDWRVSPSFTLNLGLRYEYYGVPWLDTGMTMGLQGGSAALFGVSGRDFSNWLAPNPVQYDSTYQTKQIFVGPNSPNPTLRPFNKDKNNFGPSIGFAWQLPWFGKGKTTLRAGYYITYSAIANADPNAGFGSAIGNVTGTSYSMNYFGDATSQKYISLADLPNLVPLVPASTIKPLNTMTYGERAVSLRVYDPNVVNPYNQSLSFSLARSVSSSLYAEVRYIGTLSRKSIADLNVNTANWMHNGLKESFDAARKGGTTPLLDQIFRGIQFTGTQVAADTPVYTTVNGVTTVTGTTTTNTTALNIRGSNLVGDPNGPTGGDVLRSIAAGNLANGNYNGVADTLSQANYTKNATLNTGLPTQTISKGGILRVNGFADNFIYANPQLSTANWTSNFNHGNYHSMQATLTVRPTRGFSSNLSYTWAKGLGDSGWADPSDRSKDYTWTGNSRAHQLNMYGTFDLPFGANGLLFRNVTSPIIKRAMEGWQMSWILSMQSGKRSSISDGTNQMIGGTSTPNYVAQEGVFDPSENKITFLPGARTGNYFGNKLVAVTDPSCKDETLVARSLSGSSTCSALALALANAPLSTAAVNSVGSATNAIVYRQSLPGTRGNVGTGTFEGIGVFSLDMAMGKSVQLTEGKSLTIRIDAQNILNHPTPSNGATVWNARFTQTVDPNFAFSTSSALGYISTKAGHRTFQGRIRLQF